MQSPISVVTDAGGDTMVKKRIIGSHPRGGHNRFTHRPNNPNYEVCIKGQLSTRARCKTEPNKRTDGIAQSTQFS